MSVVDWTASAKRPAWLEEELRRIVAELPRLGVQKAILFGSLASGHVRQTSDLDLILVAPTDERFARRPARFYAALNPATGLDLFVYTSEEFRPMAISNPFVRRAVAQGKVLYGA